MQRDMDLCRDILFKIEAAPYGKDVKWSDMGEGEEAERIAYQQVLLMVDGGLIDRAKLFRGGVLSNAITWQGHEFLALARNSTIWAKAKSKFAESAVAASFAALSEYLKTQTMNLLNS